MKTAGWAAAFAALLTLCAASAEAQVVLEKRGVSYPLVSTGGDGYYEYPGDYLLVQAGDTFRIEVTHLDDVATGETVVPGPPEGVTIDRSTLWVPEIGAGIPRGGFNAEDSRDLNEPPTSIEGALGVFSAFNSVAVHFEVARESN